MKFTPDPTYEGLRIQAFALANLVRCLEQLTDTNPRATIAKLKGQIESEREMNCILTKENESLKARIAYLELKS